MRIAKKGRAVLIWRPNGSWLGLPGRMVDLGEISFAEAQKRAFVEDVNLVYDGRLRPRIGGENQQLPF
jgi:hypothetical protein